MTEVMITRTVTREREDGDAKLREKPREDTANRIIPADELAILQEFTAASMAQLPAALVLNDESAKITPVVPEVPEKSQPASTVVSKETSSKTGEHPCTSLASLVVQHSLRALTPEAPQENLAHTPIDGKLSARELVERGHLLGLRFLETVGAGGFADVVYVEQVQSKLRGALKTVVKGANSGVAVKLLLEEAELINKMARIDPKHFPLFAQLVSNSPYAVLVEYVPHRLEDKVKAGLTPQQIWNYFDDICQCLETLRKHGKYHEDLKPENFRLTDDDIVKVVDLNLVRDDAPDDDLSLDHSIDVARAATEKRIRGTMRFMAPEQFEHAGFPIDEKVYVFQLAKILYYLCSTKIPQGIPKALEGEFAVLNDIILKKGLVQDREERFASVEELRLAVQKCLGCEQKEESVPLQATTILEWRDNGLFNAITRDLEYFRLLNQVIDVTKSINEAKKNENILFDLLKDANAAFKEAKLVAQVNTIKPLFLPDRKEGDADSSFFKRCLDFLLLRPFFRRFLDSSVNAFEISTEHNKALQDCLREATNSSVRVIELTHLRNKLVEQGLYTLVGKHLMERTTIDDRGQGRLGFKPDDQAKLMDSLKRDIETQVKKELTRSTKVAHSMIKAGVGKTEHLNHLTRGTASYKK